MLRTKEGLCALSLWITLFARQFVSVPENGSYEAHFIFQEFSSSVMISPCIEGFDLDGC
jgi:hypothetical protein